MNERIWIYLASRELTVPDLEELNKRSQNFVSTWTAHDVPLDASFDILFNRFLIIKVDEAAYNASGCSIDKQLRFIKETEQALGLELLNRLLVAYFSGTTVSVVPTSKIKELLGNGSIHETTTVFNNTLTHASELAANWQIPLKDSWLKKHMSIAQ